MTSALSRLSQMIFAASSRRQGAASGHPLHYSYKPSLVGAASQFELRESGLWSSVFGKSGVWPYDRIAKINLSYRPVYMQSHRFRADVENADGKHVRIYSTSWQTPALLSPQDQDYRTFLTQLHRRVAATTTLSAGVTSTIYFMGLGFVAIVMIALTALMIRGLIVGQFVAVLFLLGFGALFIWKVGGFFHRNKPRTYVADNLPKDLLP